MCFSSTTIIYKEYFNSCKLVIWRNIACLNYKRPSQFIQDNKSTFANKTIKKQCFCYMKHVISCNKTLHINTHTHTHTQYQICTDGLPSFWTIYCPKTRSDQVLIHQRWVGWKCMCKVLNKSEAWCHQSVSLLQWFCDVEEKCFFFTVWKTVQFSSLLSLPFLPS